MNILSTIAVLVASTAVTVRALTTNEKNATFESISLIDGEGKKWALLGKNPKTQNEGIYLLDKSERIVAEFVLDNRESPHLLFKSSEGSWRMSLSSPSDDECRLSFLTDAGSSPESYSERVAIGVRPESGGSRKSAGVLLVRDPEGKAHVSYGAR